MSAAAATAANDAVSIKSAFASLSPYHVAAGGIPLAATATLLPIILSVTVQLLLLGLALYKWRVELAKNTPADAPRRNYAKLIYAAVAAFALACLAYLALRPSRAAASPADADEGPDYFRDAGRDVASGTCEMLTDGRSNPDVDAMWTAVGWSPKTDSRKNAWCAVYVNHRLQQRGIAGTGSARALSFLTWGEAVELADAQPGDVLCLRRRVNGRWDGKTGHVTFFVKRSGNRVCGRGGNQSNCVTEAYFPVGDVLAVRRPRGAPGKRPKAGKVVAAGGAAGGAAAGGAAVMLDETPASAPSQVPEIVDNVKRVGETVQEPLMAVGTPSAMKIAMLIGIGCAALTIIGLWYAHRQDTHRG